MLRCITFFTAVLAEFDASNHLLVDQIRGHVVVLRIVPRREDLFSKEQSPRGDLLQGALLLGVLFALRDGVHHVVHAGAERRDLVEQCDVQREAEFIREVDFLGEQIAQFTRRGRRVRFQRFGTSVHEGDLKQQRFLVLRSLGEIRSQWCDEDEDGACLLPAVLATRVAEFEGRSSSFSKVVRSSTSESHWVR